MPNLAKTSGKASPELRQLWKEQILSVTNPQSVSADAPSEGAKMTDVAPVVPTAQAANEPVPATDAPPPGDVPAEPLPPAAVLDIDAMAEYQVPLNVRGEITHEPLSKVLSLVRQDRAITLDQQANAAERTRLEAEAAELTRARQLQHSLDTDPQRTLAVLNASYGQAGQPAAQPATGENPYETEYADPYTQPTAQPAPSPGMTGMPTPEEWAQTQHTLNAVLQRQREDNHRAIAADLTNRYGLTPETTPSVEAVRQHGINKGIDNFEVAMRDLILDDVHARPAATQQRTERQVAAIQQAPVATSTTASVGVAGTGAQPQARGNRANNPGEIAYDILRARGYDVKRPTLQGDAEAIARKFGTFQ